MSGQANKIIEIIASLQEEHREILRRMESIQTNGPTSEALLSLFNFVGVIHHQKEEELLFPIFAKSNCLSQGGPFCGYFMGLRLDLNREGTIRAHLAEFSRRSGIVLTPPPPPAWLSAQDPLSIPMEEHELAHLLSDAITELLHRESENLKDAFFETLLHDYFNLVRLHIQKEETCLFVQCTSCKTLSFERKS